MGNDCSKFGVHVFDQFFVEDDSIIDCVGGEDEVVGTWTVFGWNCFVIAQEVEEQHAYHVVSFVSALFCRSCEGALEEIVDETELRWKGSVGRKDWWSRSRADEQGLI